MISSSGSSIVFPKLEASKLILSVVPFVQIISLLLFALMKVLIDSLACSKAIVALALKKWDAR